jgi:LuxR family maltose regulon positive regulatory protein
VERAVHHVLAYAEIDRDWTKAERVICAAAETTWRSGNLTTLQTWLDALPPGRVRASGRLATYQGWILAMLGDMAAAKEYAQAAQVCYQQAEAIQKPAAGSSLCNAQDRARLLALHAFLALFCEQGYEQAIQLAEQALRALTAEQAPWRVIALWTMAEAKERTRSTAEAIEAFRQAAQAGRAQDSQFFVVIAEMSLAKALDDYGNRRQAIAVCRDAIARYKDERGKLSPIAGLIYSRLGTLYHEANELERALTYHKKGQRLAKQIGLNKEFAVFGGLSAPTLYALGRTKAALTALRAAHDLAQQTNYGDADWYLAWQVNIYLWEGDKMTAAARAAAARWNMDDDPSPLHIESHLAFSRLLIAQGRWPDAKKWLARLDELAHTHKLYRWQISIHILQALAAERSGNRQIALHLLERAVQAAAPQGYVRSFLQEGAEPLALLADTRALAPEFVDRILADAKSDGLLSQEPRGPIVEPLSDRESQVLRLIAAGLANREIAEELVIAIGTVKRHINNLYGKLGVHTRTQAIAKARELYILR